MNDYMLERQKANTLAWRKQETIEKIEGPTDPARARRLGYKAKEGFIVARVRVRKGGRKRQMPAGGRVPKKAGRFFTLNTSKQAVAEKKAERNFRNLRLLNSYQVGEDGVYKWFECILIDPMHPAILADKNISWIAESNKRGRSFRGLTSAGKKARGLRKKGIGSEYTR
jgi:large subunit ribosomal protein L15e